MDIMDFFDIIRNPEARMQKEKKKANTNDAMRTFAILGAAVGLVIGLGIAFFGGLIGLATGSVLGGLGILAIIILPIVFAILSVVGSAISAGLFWLVANLLGGKGTFEQNYYLNSRLAAPVIVASVLVGILSMIPVLGFLLQIVWNLYTVYLSIVLISVANSLTKLRSVAVWIIPILIVLFLVFVVVGSFLVAMLATLAATN